MQVAVLSLQNQVLSVGYTTSLNTSRYILLSL